MTTIVFTAVAIVFFLVWSMLFASMLKLRNEAGVAKINQMTVEDWLERPVYVLAA